MENAADALRMGAWVLIFVVALSTSINAFYRVRSNIDIIVGYSDRENYTQYTSGSGDLHRKVTYQDIIPTIYRAYKENYKIVFDGSTGIGALYRKKEDASSSGSSTIINDINYIDLEKEAISDVKVPGDAITLKEYFIRRVIYGNNGKFGDPTKDNWCEGQLSRIYFPEQANGPTQCLYDKIRNSTVEFTEYLGIYYQEEVATGFSDAPEANRTEKRVITYKN